MGGDEDEEEEEEPGSGDEGVLGETFVAILGLAGTAAGRAVQYTTTEVKSSLLGSCAS